MLRKWEDAVHALSKAIAVDADNYLGYMKRASAYIGAGKSKKALADLEEVLRRKPKHEKTLLKKAELLLAQGDFDLAQNSLKEILQTSAGGKLYNIIARLVAMKKEANTLAQAKNFDGAIRLMEEMVSVGANRESLGLEKCKLFFEAGKYYDVVSEAMGLLKKDPHNSRVLILRAKAFFQLGELEGATNHLKQCLRFEADNEDCIREHEIVGRVHNLRTLAMQAFKSNQFLESIAPLKAALEASKNIEALVIELTTTLCEAYARGATSIDLWQAGVRECTKAAAIEGAPDSMMEFKGDLNQKLGNWNDAIQDFSAMLQKQPNNHRMRQKIQAVQNQKKIAERKDYYKILDVPRDAQRRQIKTAFRKLALKWHPDRNSENEEKANQMFQDINEAYDVLTNEEKKGRYDRGEDVDEQQQQRHQGFNPFGGGQQFHFKFN